MRDKYHKESGTILNYCEIRIDKNTKKVSLAEKEKKIIVSNEKSYVIESEYNTLQIVEKKWSKYATHRGVNHVSVHEQKWGIKSMPDCIIARHISTFSKKVTFNRTKKKLFEFLAKESYFYSGIITEIENQLESL